MKSDRVVIGWREWLRLPDLDIKLIKAKVDTGARTSALHAEDIELFQRGGHPMVRFVVHPKQRSRRGAVHSIAPLADQRPVRNSGGHTELRPVIITPIDVGGVVWPVEITLTRRDVMGFRMLLGRQAIRGHALVDPGRSYLTRKIKRRPKK